jgi:hypothetical protein
MYKTIDQFCINITSSCCPCCGSEDYSIQAWHLQLKGGFLFEWVCNSCKKEWQQANLLYKVKSDPQFLSKAKLSISSIKSQMKIS